MTDQETIQAFDNAVHEAMQRYKLSRERAVESVRRRNPALAKAYLVASQSNVGAKRRVSEFLERTPSS